MLHEVFHLKECYPSLADCSNDPTLTSYLPYNLSEMGWQDRLYPAILVCPGGGYTWCSQREDEPIALKLLAMGYRVFILNYSCAPCRFPTQLREVAAAIELIHANAAGWHIDTGRIAIMGFSAGGHLAGHYSNCYDCPEVRSVFPNSKGVTASILCYPVITSIPEYRNYESFNNLAADFSETEIERFSLEKLVTDKTPPTFLWHTATDDVVPVANSLLYAGALAQHNVPFELHIYTNGQHGLSTADEMTCAPIDESTRIATQWLPALQNWLKTTL